MPGLTALRPALANIVDMAGQILADNVGVACSADYLTTPAPQHFTLKTTEKATDTGQFIWDATRPGEGRMNGIL